MYLSFVTGNVLQKFAKDRYNVVLYPQNNLFDHSVFDLKNNYYIFGKNSQNYNTANVIDLPEHMISLYNYNLCMTNNIIGYSTSNLKKFHINSIIFTHSGKPNYIKKEDAAILNNNLSRELKVFFNDTSYKSWGFKNNTHVIRYGIPRAFKKQNAVSDRKDILILNAENAIHNKQLLNMMQSQGYQCDSLDSFTHTSEELNSIFNNYKICIELAEHNISNLLAAIASGCKAVTIKTQMIDQDYSNIPGLYSFDSIASIIETIPTILAADLDTESSSKNVLQKFDFDIFADKINQLTKQANTEAFII